MDIKCRYAHTLLSSSTGYMVVCYTAVSPIPLPDGTTTRKFTAKGYLLPEGKDIEYILKGDFEPYKRKEGVQTYTLQVTGCDEIQPTQKDSIIAYLITLDGVGKVMAKRMYDTFGDNVFNIMENDLATLAAVKGISQKKAKTISKSYGKRKYARELFQYLYPFRIKDNQIILLYKKFGSDAIRMIKENPYCITEIAGIGFKTAERIAKSENLPDNFPGRIEAGILEVLLQGEVGGDLFRASSPFPRFVYYSFLQERLYNLLSCKDNLNVTGNTYLPRHIVYLMTLKLLNIPLSEQVFDETLVYLHRQKRLMVYDYRENDIREIRVYRYSTAKSEIMAAKDLIRLIDSPSPICDDLEKRVYTSERLLNIRLSDEQNQAVRTAISHPVSVITGGPGTGKTAVQKGILSVYKGLYPDKSIHLLAPTGRAAKRMSESTGYPASTLHRALALYNNERGELVTSETQGQFMDGLIIVDECSMVGSILFEKLLSSIAPGAHLVLVGDIDQLPSIEVGAVLREVINSTIIPVTRLTKTYRQANGSPIAVNAARIKNGITNLEYQEDFVFLEESNSHGIAQTTAELYTNLVSQYGTDDVICLSAFRRSTESGTDALNQLLRSSVRNDITDKTPHIERKGQTIYEGDLIMYTRNSEELTNGDVGLLKEIKKDAEGIALYCIFDGKPITLDDEESAFIELAYATTVHKSQGSEYKVVIMTADNAHKIMQKRNLLYTGITRAKQKLYIVGQMECFKTGILTQDSVFRRSQLAFLIRHYASDQKNKENNESEQLKMSL